MEIAEYKPYDQIARIFHWLTAALMLLALAAGLMMVRLPDGPDQDRLFDFHRSIGAAIFAIVALRLLWRLTHRAPKLPASIPAIQRFAADVTHWLLYGLMLVQPVIGWVGGSAFGDRMRLFGFFDLPMAVTKDDALGEIVMATHRFVGFAIIAVIALHLAAAAWHSARGDDVMRRMWW